jgi:transcriptional regulator with XRE-family HTH domain
VGVEDRFATLLLRALGQRIRELRTEQGYSQEGFADKCGVHRTFMGTVERGESNLSFLNLARVATTLDIPLATLFMGLEGRAKHFGAPGGNQAEELQRSIKMRPVKSSKKASR